MSAANKQNHMNSMPVDHDFEQNSTIEDTDIKIPVVRRLSRPPEIWELVQPVPATRTGFTNPFSVRLPSSRSILILLVAVIVGVGGYIGIRSGKRIAGTTTTPVVTASHVYSSKAAATVKQTPVQESNVPTRVVTPGVSETTAVAESDKPKRKVSHRSKPIGSATDVANSSVVSPSASSVEASQVSLPSNQKAQSLTNTSKSNSVESAPSRKESSLSPQLINSSKAKLIQWP
jgi:hypothetical protein